MTVRTGMQTLINTVRGFANAGASEWTIETDSAILTFWDDAEIQKVLDHHKTQHVHSQLEPVVSYEGGVGVYKIHGLGDTDIESGDNFVLSDINGTASTTGFTVDYSRGLVTFTTDQVGKALFWDGYAYDLNAAAAEIWRTKAAHAAEQVDWSSDNHSVKKSQLSAAYLKMADMYSARSKSEGMTTIRIMRGDL